MIDSVWHFSVFLWLVKYFMICLKTFGHQIYLIQTAKASLRIVRLVDV